MWLGARPGETNSVIRKTAAVLATLSCLAVLPLPAAAEEAPAEVAYVESVSGRAIAIGPGRPTQLDALDLVAERTRIDLLAASEMRLCHFRTQRSFELKGPLQTSISREGISIEPAKSAATAAGNCVAPAIASYQGGIALRSSANIKSIEVPLRPSIKIIDRGKPPINKIALWDGDYRKVLLTFGHDRAQPALDDGQSYILFVGRSDGSELKLRLQSKASNQSSPLIVLAR